MKKRRAVLRLFLFLALILTIFTLYLQVGFLPGRLRTFVIQKTEELTGERVIFDKAFYVPFKGLSFSDFRIVASDKRVLFSVKKLSLDVRVIPFMKEKKLIVRNVTLESPVYHWALEGPAPPLKESPPPPRTKISGQITVPVLPEKSSPELSDLDGGPDAFLPENVYLEQFEIVNGRVLVREHSGGPVIEEIVPIRLKMGFQKPPVIRFHGSFGLGTKPYAAIDLSGGWDLEKTRYDFNLRASARRIPSWLARIQKMNPVILKKGALDLEARLASAPRTEKIALFHIQTALNDASLSVSPLELDGQMNLEAEGVFDFSKKAIDRYQGRLDLSRVRVSHPAEGVAPLEDLSGTFYFKPDFLRAKSVTAAYGPLALEAEGDLRSFSKPILNSSVKTRSALSDLLSVLPKTQRSFLKDWVMEGLCDAKVSVRGPLKDPSKFAWEASAILQGGAAKNAAKKIDLSEISGHLLAGPEKIRVAQGRVTAFNNDYRIEGDIPLKPDKSAPISVSSADQDLKGHYSWAKDLIKIHDAEVGVWGVRGRLQGTSTGFKRPRLELRGDFETELEKLVPKVLPHVPALKDAGLKGHVDGRFILNGWLDAPLDWDLKLDANADRLRIREKFRIDDVHAQVRMKNRVLNIPYLHAKPYGGSGGFRSSFDLSKKEVPFDGKLYVNNVDLSFLARDLDPKQKELTGKLTLNAALRGKLQSQETFTGSGTINVREGRIWKTDLFKDMGHLPFVKVVGLDQVVFHALNANFKIADKKSFTQDLTLDSDTVHLVFKGHVGFDQTLDLIMWIRYSDAVIRGAVDTGGIVPFVVEKAEQFISQHKISGTLKSPKNEKLLAPPV